MIALHKALVRKILIAADQFEWSLQGFGMLRLYLDPERKYRLHVWDSLFAVPGVSMLHDHPWIFESQVVAGVVEQYRYERDAIGDGDLFDYQQIVCGPGGCAKSEPHTMPLRRGPREMYREGESYMQVADEIHSSHPQRGTVTMIARKVIGDGETARVFWPTGERWVSAEPRKATASEVRAITGYALDRWF